MKTKSSILIGIVIATFITSSQAFAGTWCYSATVKAIGIQPGLASSYKVSLTCNDGNPPWTGSRDFYIRDDADLKKVMYATGLTAMSLGQEVEVFLAASKSNSLINRMRILKTPNP